MRPTSEDLRLWNWYKLPRFAASLQARAHRPSIHAAINSRAGLLPRGRAADYANTLSLLRLARSNYERDPLCLHHRPGEPVTFREYIRYLAGRRGETLGRRAYCGRIYRRLNRNHNE